MISDKPGPLTRIERWITQNYQGFLHREIPKVYDRKKDLYWKIGKRVYGPIKWLDIPVEIRNNL